MVDELLSQGKLQVEALHATERWFGMSYEEDRPAVAAALKALHRAGNYPASLRG